MHHEIHLDLDTASDQFKELQDGYLNGKTYTIERSGITYTGCRIANIRLEGPGNDVRGYVTLMAPFNSALPEIVSTPEGRNDYCDLSELHADYRPDFSEIEARTLAWLDDNQQFGGVPFDPTAKSFYDKRIRDDRIPAGVNTGRLTVKPDDITIPSRVQLGSSYPHKMEYAKGGPWAWKRPGVHFYPNKKFRFGVKSMNRQWEFKSVHPQDIDFDELCESVTRQNPLALVKGTYTEKATKERPKRDKAGNQVTLKITEPVDTGDDVIFSDRMEPIFENYTVPVEREENYVVIHRSLWDKSAVAAIDLPTALAPKRVNGYGARVYADVKTAELRNWVAWAKEVRAASWHDEDRRKATFVVDLPKV